MANDSRSRQRNKDFEGDSSGKSMDSGEGTLNSGTLKVDASRLRQTTQGASSSGQMTSSPSSTRKSERLEKRMPSTPLPVIRKSERLEKQSAPSPLRRSDRSRALGSSTSYGSKSLEKVSSSADRMSRREKKQKSVKQLTMGTENVNHGEKWNQESFGVKRKRMDARSYKDLFKRKQICSASGREDELERHDLLPQVDSGGNMSCLKQLEDKNEGHECGMRVTEDSREKPLERAVSGAAFGLKDCDAKISEPNINSTTGNSQIPEMVTLTCMASPLGCNTKLESGARCMQSEEKGSTINVAPDVTGILVSKSVSALVAESDPAASGENDIYGFVGNCAVCCKRRRSDYDSPKEELCSCGATLSCTSGDISRNKDSGNLEAAFNSESVGRHNCIPRSKETLSVTKTDVQNVCVMCKKGGKLLFCAGESCRRCYHVSCLDPSLVDETPGVWHCAFCVKKKIEFGVHTVSKGVESIWDVREVVVSDMKGIRRQKQYLVKYQGLAHFYNHWVSETLMLHESPSLVEKFNREHQIVTWNPEWRLPHRLLRKRRLMSFSHQDEYPSSNNDAVPYCQFEWLVKWRGLDYEHATWEVDSMKFLHSPQGQRLVREYEIRHQKTRKVSDKSAKGAFTELQKLPAGGSFRADDNMLNNVNKLREFWYKNQSVVVFDEQDQLETVILFIKALSEHHQPFLIVTTSAALSQWEVEFMRIALSVDVVVYSGNRDTRSIIRTLEFYDESGGILLQVLLSTMEIVSEDLQTFKEIKWEAVIVDECQSRSMNTNVALIKVLQTNVRLLLFSSQLKDVVAEYQYVLSLLDSSGDLKLNLSDNLVKLKESLSHFTAYGSKFESSKFVEYWVPVPISNLQLEQYCSMLLKNTIALCSPSKRDGVGALLDILKTLRKCCSHPYTVDLYTKTSVIKGLQPPEMLDVGITASGKLHLLDLILSKIRRRKLRVLILFQSNGSSEGTPIGSILEDFLAQRFGQNSYEGFGATFDIMTKRQATMDRFNSKEGGEFVFLLDIRACMPSIKLSVDIVVLFDTDWNPANDMKALQRISIISQSDQIKVFRLYSSYTLEEKVLILAKHNKNVESNLRSSSRATDDTLLMWGASYLFRRLDNYHAEKSTASAADVSSGQQRLLDDIVKDFMAKLLDVSKNNNEHDSIISKVFHSEGVYHSDCLLLGEREVKSTDGEERQIYWKKLLEGRNPRWKLLPGSTLRSRKRVHYAENDEPAKKHQKVLDGSDSPSFQPEVEERIQAPGSKAAANQSESLPISVSCTLGNANKAIPLSGENPFSHESDMAHLEERTPNEQKSLHILLRAEMAKLCDVLKLSNGVNSMVQNFLEYVMENRHVNKERASILQAFQMSLCWIAASIMKEKIERRDSLNLAKQILNFQCTKEETDIVYDKLRPLKSTFLQLLRNKNGLMPSKSVVSASEDVTEQSLKAGEPPSEFFKLQNVKVEVEESSFNLEPSQWGTIDQLTVHDVVRKKFKKFQKKRKDMLKLHQKQEEEIQKFHKMREQTRVQLENEHRLESAFIRTTYNQTAMEMDKLKIADSEFEKKIQEHECIMEMQLKQLEARHAAAIEEESKRAADWLAQMKSGLSEQRNVNEQHMHGSEYCEMGSSEGSGRITSMCPENEVHHSRPDLGEQSPDRIVHVSRGSIVIVSHIPVTAADDATGYSTQSKTVPIAVNSVSDEALEIVAAEASSVTRVDQSKESSRTSNFTPEVNAKHAGSCSVPDETSPVLLHPTSEKASETIPVGTSSFIRFDQPKTAEYLSQTSQEITPNCSSNGAEEIVCINLATYNGQNTREISSSGQDYEIPSGLPRTAGSEIGNACTSEMGALLEFNTENGTGNSIGSDVRGNQEGRTHNSICGTALSGQMQSVDLIMVQTFPPPESPTQCIEDLPIAGDLNTAVGLVSSTPLEAGLNIQLDCDAQLAATSEPLQLASSSSSPEQSQPAAEAVHQVPIEGSNPLQNSDASPQFFERSANLSHEAVLLAGENLVQLVSECSPSICSQSTAANAVGQAHTETSEACIGENLVHPASDFSSRVCSQPATAEAVQQSHVEGSNSRQTSDTSTQLVEESLELSHQALSQDGENLVQLASHHSSPVRSQPAFAEAAYQNNVDGSNSVQTSEALTVDRLVQLASNLSSPVCRLPPIAEAVHEGQIEGRNSLQGSIQLVDTSAELSLDNVPQNCENLIHPASNSFTPLYSQPTMAASVDQGHIERANSLRISEASNLSSPVCRQPTITEAVHQGQIAGSNALQTSEASIQLVDRCAEHSRDDVPQSSENFVHFVSNCSSPPVCSLPSAAESVDQGHIETGNSLQTSEASSPVVEGSVLLSQLAVSLNGENLVPPPSTEGRSGLNLQTINGTNHDCSAELSVVSHNSVVPTQVVDNAAELINQALQQSRPNVAVAEGSAHLSVRQPHHVASSNLPLPLQVDPLQNELERIRKEVEQTTTLHDSTKLRFQSECEKEIEEMIAQIRSKYEAKHRDAETAFLLKKTELDTNQKKVLMNKILAEAFRSKCLDLKPSAVLSMPQGAPVSFIQRVNQLSLQPTGRHPFVATLSPAGLPSVSQQTAMPPVQSLHRSSGLFPSVPARPPQISAITPSTGGVRVSGEKRAPAPHLQPFRPPGCTSAAASSSCIPGNIPNQQVPINLPARSVSLPPVPNQQPLPLPSQFLLQQNPSPPTQPTAALQPSRISQAVSSSRPSQPESGVQPGCYNPSQSAVELLMDIDNQAGGHLPTILQHLAGSGLNTSMLDPSVTRAPGNVDRSLKLPAVASDVVCLSDDED
ncbi:uncharacterized protein [Coffea arabica]|uniref:Uncharacterized protein isoform X1 n=2 Tax=Coffea TaxID=13442 RepID=A0A6P6U4R8_COFAR|nr:helicase protein MOM1-like [Coffea arabica]